MNDLQMVSSKIVSAREVIDSAAEAIQRNDYNKAETLAMAAYEFLGYYLDEFDDKFQLAWQETVVKQKDLVCDGDDLSPECKTAWSDFWQNYDTSPLGNSDQGVLQYTDEELDAMCSAAEKQHNKKSWLIMVEEAYNKDGETIFSYIQLPDEIIEHMNLNESSHLRWIDNEDGTVTIKKS